MSQIHSSRGRTNAWERGKASTEIQEEVSLKTKKELTDQWSECMMGGKIRMVVAAEERHFTPWNHLL